jgi:hypothetical protein
MLRGDALHGVARTVGVLAVIAIAAIAIRDGPGPLRAFPVTLLYVGADDCGPCRTWQQHEKIAFSASPEFARLTYREVKSPTLFDVLKHEIWPEDLRGYRSRLGPDAGVPLWFVIANGQVIHVGMGPSQWNSEVLPTITELLRRSASERSRMHAHELTD